MGAIDKETAYNIMKFSGVLAEQRDFKMIAPRILLTLRLLERQALQLKSAKKTNKVRRALKKNREAQSHLAVVAGLLA
jgi:hypothetical protein